MAKFKIDHNGSKFVTTHKGYEISHPIFSSLVKQLREAVGRSYSGYKVTKKASDALKSKSFD